jgi:hypothetical protein
MAQTSTLTVMPKLADLIGDLGIIALLPVEAIPTMRRELARLDPLLLVRLIAGSNGQAAQSTKGDRLLDVKEAAETLGMKAATFVYTKAISNLPKRGDLVAEKFPIAGCMAVRLYCVCGRISQSGDAHRWQNRQRRKLRSACQRTCGRGRGIRPSRKTGMPRT